MKGTHTVTITAVETLTPQSQKWHAPKEYSDPTNSGLTTLNGKVACFGSKPGGSASVAQGADR